MTMPTKWEIAQHWGRNAERHRFAPRMYDLGEPCCFACGWYSEHWDKDSPRASWERARLDRAHIVPASMNGPDSVDNLLLLCGPCHKESPDWPDPEEMARWIADRPARRNAEYEEREAWTQAAAEVPEFAQLAVAMAAGIAVPQRPALLADLLHSRPGEPEVSEQMQVLLREALKHAGTHHSVGISPGTRTAVLRRAAHLFSQPQPPGPDHKLSRLT